MVVRNSVYLTLGRKIMWYFDDLELLLATERDGSTRLFYLFINSIVHNWGPHVHKNWKWFCNVGQCIILYFCQHCNAKCTSVYITNLCTISFQTFNLKHNCTYHDIFKIQLIKRVSCLHKNDIDNIPYVTIAYRGAKLMKYIVSS